MGFFSWKTSDTNESIFNVHTDKCKTVYLLQPHGQPPIKEVAYDGYGVFGGIDAYEWLARANLSKSKIQELEAQGGNALRIYGIKQIAYKRLYLFNDTGVTCDESELIDLKNDINYSTKQERFDNKSINELLESGKLSRIKAPLPQFPLKFSFNQNAVYENLPAAKDCPSQGFFRA